MQVAEQVYIKASTEKDGVDNVVFSSTFNDYMNKINENTDIMLYVGDSFANSDLIFRLNKSSDTEIEFIATEFKDEDINIYRIILKNEPTSNTKTEGAIGKLYCKKI